MADFSMVVSERCLMKVIPEKVINVGIGEWELVFLAKIHDEALIVEEIIVKIEFDNTGPNYAFDQC